MTNYIHHLNQIMIKMDEDIRLTPYHISIYMALFHHWNLDRFSVPFFIAREDVLKMSKIRSKTTYSNCLKELHEWQYFSYKASKSKYIKSEFDMTIFNPISPHSDSSTEPLNGLDVSCTEPLNGLDVSYTEPLNGLDVVPNNKHYKPNNKTVNFFFKKEIDIINFFISEGLTKADGQLFWNHYESRGWKTTGNIPIENWQAAAKSWILKGKLLKAENQAKNQSYLSTIKNKNYNEPL